MLHLRLAGLHSVLESKYQNVSELLGNFINEIIFDYEKFDSTEINP